MEMWTASAEPDHISTASAATTPHIERRRPEDGSHSSRYQERRGLSEIRDFGVLTNRAIILVLHRAWQVTLYD